MKRTLPLMFLFVAACSSAPKEETPAPAKSRDLWEDGADFTATPKKETPRAAVEAPKAPEAAGQDPWADLNAAIKSQNDEQIRRVSERILARVPNDEKALNALGLVAYRKGQFTYASYLLGKAIQKNPNKSELHSNIGLVALAQGERTEAVKSFRRAIELNPDDGVAAANLGSIYVAEHDYQKAATVLDIALRKGPRDAKVINNQAIALMATGRADRAKGLLEDGLKDNPNNRELMFNQAILLVDHLGRYQEALDLINRLKFVGAPSESRERLSLLENKAKAGLK